MRKKLLALFCSVMAILPLAAISQATKKGPTLGVSFGLQDFETARRIRSTSLAEANWAGLDNMQPALMLSFLNGISPNVDYSVNLMLSSLKYPFRDNTPSRAEGLYTTLDASAHIKLLSDNHFFSPYLAGGVGASMFEGGRFDAFMPLGVGAQFRIAPRSFIFSNFRYNVPVTSRANYYFTYTLGFAGFVGKEPEVKPLPVVEPAPPSDRDKDGIIDENDKCPDVPGLARYEGCPIPDSDGDGINDEQDKCPKVAGVAKYQGCPIPDSDGDGINDEEDKCPNTPGEARFQGCPNPDRDGDGIRNEDDRCPDVPGVPEMQGCPKIDYEAHAVRFAVSSATLTADGKAELDKLADFLKQHDGIRIRLDGYTDASGNDKINIPLSQKRAAAAKDYLVSQGIGADRIETEGHGAADPVGDNKTKEGKARNRRIEVTVL